MSETVDQHGMTPTAKVTAASAAGATAVLIVYLAGLFGVELGPEAGAALATLLAFAAGYFKRERKDTP